ncbi:MAG: Ig-like domain-containing protein [Gemmatimonadota bacterium]|nr:MAG: Ig-like domain-containing protein [Gemmatimonadota bacterium]
MIASSFAVLLSLGAAGSSQQQQHLDVLRATPQNEAIATAVIRVTFDRPVAGALGSTIDPSAIFEIQPPVDGRVEWRDPVTLRFIPARPLVALTTYTVTIANTFEAMDGSRLESTYHFSFRVKGPTILNGSPVNQYRNPQFLTPDQTFELLVGSLGSAEGALDRLVATASVEFDSRCRTSPIRLTRAGQRGLSDDDSWDFRTFTYREPWNRHPEGLTVLELRLDSPMPRDCSGFLVVRENVDSTDATLLRWPFRTYGDFTFRGASCGSGQDCPTGPVRLFFSTPVRGADIQRHVTVSPAVSFTVADTSAENHEWYLEAELRPRSDYAVVVDPEIRDVYGQPLLGNLVAGLKTTGYGPTLAYAQGRWLVERRGPRTLSVQHINLDSLELIVARVPVSLEAPFLSESWWAWRQLWDSVASSAARRTIQLGGEEDEGYVTGLRLPAMDARRPDSNTLLAVTLDSPQLDSIARRNQPIALVQVTDLAVHTRFGADGGTVWVTGVGDGLPRAGATVTLHDEKGAVVAHTQSDAWGLARFSDVRPERSHEWYGGLKGYVSAQLEDDRAVVGLSSENLAPWDFNVYPAYGASRKLRAATVFTERGIYRPGEPVYAKAIVRRGPLGALAVPASDDSLRWIFKDREDGTLKDTTVAPSPFGTADQKLVLQTELPLGSYRVDVQMKDDGEWATVASTSYRVAEYRPPEFLVDVITEDRERYGGDSVRAGVDARYLFGAPMGRAAVTWVARQRPGSPWEIDIPDSDGFYFGDRGDWWDYQDTGPSEFVISQGTDTLDAAGHLDVELALPAPRGGLPSRTAIEATVTDVNRQAASSSTAFTVHPSAFYIGAKPLTKSYFWQAGEPVRVELIAARPSGERVSGVAIAGLVVRREWHQVRRRRGGYTDYVSEWVADTVATCNVISEPQPTPCEFTPPEGGSYTVAFQATDEHGRLASTRFNRWATGPDWVPWYDETRFKMDVIPDRERYSVGDTAKVLFASPFTDAEAWVTVEREGIIEERRLRIASGSTTLEFPITETHAPNAYVSVIVVRGRSEPPGQADDPGRPTMRVGYAQLRVTPEVKRLTVDVRPDREEYRPGDTVAIQLAVRDVEGTGRRSEVTLWAVDEGVLALTGYRLPDILDRIYQERGLGVELSSNLVAVLEQVEAAETRAKGEPGGGGGIDMAGVLRSRFRPTAFFLGSVVTDDRGRAVARAGLPDNVTTFRVFAVAVTAGDRYGSGESSILVTRPLLARPALPRFTRPGDEFSAGVIVNHRLGGTPTVDVRVEAEQVDLIGDRRKTITLEASRGREARFNFQGIDGDSATFRFMVQGAGEADAVQSRIAIRPPYHPRAYTVAGVLGDTEYVDFELPGDIDPDRSRLEIQYGGSPLTIIRGIQRRLRVYPYYCSEQVASAAIPLIALYRVQQETGDTLLRGDPAADIEAAVSTLSRRQNPDGSIGYWSADGWSNPWISAHAGRVLMEARAAGFAVGDSVLARLGGYLDSALRERVLVRSPLRRWYDRHQSIRMADAVAAVDFLRRLGRPNVPMENTLYREAAQLSWEDRLLLAEVLSQRGDRRARDLLEAAWADVTVEGRRAVLPDSARNEYFYFPSWVRPTARLLTATLAVEPDHPLVGPLVETLVMQGRTQRPYWWNTQDFAYIALALLEYDKLVQAASGRRVTISHGERTLSVATAEGRAPYEMSLPLTGLLTRTVDGKQALNLSLSAGDPGPPVYFYATVQEVPLERPVRPSEAGIQVERWYESYDQATPITQVAEGNLVRVKLRITVPSERYFVVIDDALPAGLEAVDLSLRTVGSLPSAQEEGRESDEEGRWFYGSWDYGYWSPFDHKEIRDDRVVYSATVLWPGTYYATYVARATTPGAFIKPPAHAEEMYNPAVNGRSDGGSFTVEGPAR